MEEIDPLLTTTQWRIVVSTSIHSTLSVFGCFSNPETMFLVIKCIIH